MIYHHDNLRIIQFTDMHIFNSSEKLLGMDTTKSFKAVLDEYKKIASDSDVFILTGDLIQDNNYDSYKKITNILSEFENDIYYIPGNHDMPKHSEYLQSKNILHDKCIELNHFVIVLLSSVDYGKVPGCIDENQQAILKNYCEKFSNKKIIMIFHHPLFEVECKWLDPLCVYNKDEVLDMCNLHDNIKYCFTGHIHQEYKVVLNNIEMYSTPSTCIQFYPKSDAFKLEKIAPGFRIININNNKLTTQVKRVESFDFDYSILDKANGY